MCKTCIRLNICCEGYEIRLRWDGNERTRKPRKSTSQFPFPDQSEPRPEGVKKGSCSSPPMQRTLSPSPSRNDRDGFLLQHFYFTVADLLSSTSDRSTNTYCMVIMPMAQNSEVLHDAILSISAAHLSSRSPEFAICASQYRARVLCALISTVHNAHELDETTLAIVTMLFLQEVSRLSPAPFSKICFLFPFKGTLPIYADSCAGLRG